MRLFSISQKAEKTLFEMENDASLRRIYTIYKRQQRTDLQKASENKGARQE